MTKLKHLFSTLVLLLLMSSLFAQQKTIGGIVKSADNIPLEGVTVTIKELNRSVVTSADGSYKFTAVGDRGKTLEFSSVGYEYLQQSIGDKQDLSITMKTVPKTLGELVI